MYNRGGQRRTITATCGWTRVGHPQEVNKLYLLHKKYCKSCQETDYEAPAFNKEAGNINGWRGILPSGQQPLHIQSTCLVEGRRVEVISEAHSVEEATRGLSLGFVRDNIIETASTMSEPAKKKKRKSKKSKKVLMEHIKEVEEGTCDDPECNCKVIGKAETDEDLAKIMEAERIAFGGDPDCPCCIITADRIIRENIEGTNYCRIIIKDRN